MLVKDLFTVAIDAIRINKLRSMLTMLGIIIGVAALITMVSLGTGAQQSVQSRIEALGPDLLTVFPGQSRRGGVASETRVSLTVDDAQALARDRGDPRCGRAVPPTSASVFLLPRRRADRNCPSGTRRSHRRSHDLRD